ncbi:fasciclin domain-containing protein [Micromonospora maris]|uniref:fasciclin domain-containing protein n=1 Tax=Micromonospora maris TaxID=1003110 RepID=UPI0011D23DF0|nr:fasciclin domain-containing protein [Micromonospora maris]
MTDRFPAAVRPAPRRPRRQAVPVAGMALAALLAVTACSDGGKDGETARGDNGITPVAVSVTGPLCAELPAGTEPGNPDSLTGMPAHEALQWIPVLTTFEAAVRATGLGGELTGVTVLAPTDDAFAEKFSRTNLDELLLHDTDELRELLREHLVTGPMSVSEMVAAGTVKTLAEGELTITGQDSGARFGTQAETVCADYRAVNTRIHVIDHVLGSLPTTAGGEDDHPYH